jgi:hypothetical protein
MMTTEPMAWPPGDDAALASALAQLRDEVAFPPTPPVAAAVGERLRTRPLQTPRFLGRWTGLGAGLRLGRGLAFALIALLVVAAAAVAFGIVIGGLRITFAPGTPPPIPSGVVRERAFGPEVDLDAARARAGFTVLMPDLPSLGPAHPVFYNDFPSGGTVALVWGARDGYPVDATTGVGVVLTEFQATVERQVWEKMIFGDTSVTVTRTVVNGQPAYWIAGGYHSFFYRDASGRRVDATLRLVGTTLIWLQDGLLLRVEGAPNLEGAAAIARSLR